ncbi:hypothetical protein DSO57_1006580 [Entomophthora muscae]|uniref:Uncharacterized protein n=1 Tax=Entomophthora muscae TaxID=34485 RepID=A0ACC2TV01_9FUNG|nr:hypothetical protein DSO57_1006580 [Entomophthora muscae]
MEIILLVITGIGTVLLGVTLLLVCRSQSECIAKATLGQVLVGVMMYSISTFVGVLMPYESGVGCQMDGFLQNMGILVFPFAVMLRYVYFYYVVVLERPVVASRWVIGAGAFWLFAFVVSSMLAGLGLYQLEQGIPYCMASFSSRHPVDIVNSVTYAACMVLGGIAHSASSYFILAKSQAHQQDTCRKRHRAAVLKKIYPCSYPFPCHPHPLYLICYLPAPLCHPAPPTCQHCLYIHVRHMLYPHPHNCPPDQQSPLQRPQATHPQPRIINSPLPRTV